MNVVGVMIKYKFYEYSRTAEAREHLSKKSAADMGEKTLGRGLKLFTALHTLHVNGRPHSLKGASYAAWTLRGRPSALRSTSRPSGTRHE
eukprot:13740864-Heterocapsa_arctica.AAC.1